LLFEANLAPEPNDEGSWVTQKGILIMRRVVVTGLGLVSPLGCGSELAWSRLLAARSGLAALPEWAAALPARVAGIVPTKTDDKQRFASLLFRHQGRARS
jgi:3-oxoacyl-(acyl-carrier-protein) synthase